jgi:lysophospholipase L1-like esterase
VSDAATIIVCLGDSITGAPDLRSYAKWPDLLGLLCDSHCGDGAVAVRNHGIAGDTTAGMLGRLGAALAARPTVLVLLAGGNDAGQGVPRATTAANLAAIAARSAAAGARLLGLRYHLVVHPDRPQEAWRHLPANNDLLDDAVRAAGGETVDTAAAMAAAAATMPPAQLCAPDAVHLNPGGELVYARTVFAGLRRLGWIPSPAPTWPTPTAP